MLAAVAIWLVAFSAAWGFGGLLCPEKTAIESQASRIYAGLLIFAAVLFSLALFTGLSLWTGLLVATVGIALGIRDSLRDGMPILIKRAWWVCIPIALFVTTREVNFYDTALYHQQAVRWLSEFGLVKGVALIYFRFGWTSSWFAAVAPLNHGVLEGRLAQIAGGIPFVLLLAPIAAVRGAISFRSAAWLIFSGMLAAVSIAWNVDTSLSPDPLLWLLPAVVASMLTDDDAPSLGPATVVAALACLAKLNAAPVLAYCCAVSVWTLFRQQRNRGKLIGYLAASAGIIALLVYSNVRISGCPAFPSPLGCIASDWSIDRPVANIERDLQEFARSSRHNQTIPLTLAAVVASLMCIKWKRASPMVRHSLGICWSGIVFVLAFEPVPRYGMGYFLWPTAMAGAHAALGLVERRWLPLVSMTTVAAASSLAMCSAASVLFLLAGRSSELLYPRRMAGLNGDAIHVVNRQFDFHTTLLLQPRQRGALMIWTPMSSDQCWDAPLPCTPGLTSEGVALRDPQRGFAGGFLRTPLLLVQK